MTRVADVLAQALAAAGLGTYRADGTPYATGERAVFVGHTPETPDRALTVSGSYGGPEANYRHPWRETDHQVRIRGAAADSYDTTADVAAAVFDALHTLPVPLFVGDLIVHSVIGKQAGPVALGRDDQDRQEFTVNVRADHQRTT